MAPAPLAWSAARNRRICDLKPHWQNGSRPESALVFSSGYAAATGAIPALITSKDVIVLDKLCHASLLDGVKLSGALLRVFPHNHVGKAESHLEWARREHPQARILIITESVSSQWMVIWRLCANSLP